MSWQTKICRLGSSTCYVEPELRSEQQNRGIRGVLTTVVNVCIKVPPSKLRLSVDGDDCLTLSQIGIADHTVVKASLSGRQEEEEEKEEVEVGRRRLKGVQVPGFSRCAICLAKIEENPNGLCNAHLEKVLGLWRNNYRDQPNMEQMEQEAELEVERGLLDIPPGHLGPSPGPPPTRRPALLDTRPYLLGVAPLPPPAPRPALLGYSPDHLFPATAVTELVCLMTDWMRKMTRCVFSFCSDSETWF